MDDVVVDACRLINLCAAGELRERFSKLGGEWHVPTVVFPETLYLHVARADGTVENSLLDLQAYVEEGVLLACTAEAGTELELYVDLATRLDDGEAMALAIAKTRSWTFSTDDRKAKRIASELAVNVLTTPQIMKRWADVAKPSADELRESLRRIELHASFFPDTKDVLHAWWRKNADD